MLFLLSLMMLSLNLYPAMAWQQRADEWSFFGSKWDVAS